MINYGLPIHKEAAVPALTPAAQLSAGSSTTTLDERLRNQGWAALTRSFQQGNHLTRAQGDRQRTGAVPGVLPPETPALLTQPL